MWLRVYFMYRVIDEFDLKDKRVFIRTDYNIPVKGGVIQDDTRIRASLSTLEYAINQGAKIIIGSHLGRPKGGREEKFSLFPIAAHLTGLLNKEVVFPENCVGDSVRKLASELRPGDVLLLENLRFCPEEESNNEIFSKQLAQLADIYIDDSFGTVHRAHASTNGMVKFFKEKGIGFLVQKELKFLQILLQNPQKPFLAVLGGAKVTDKIGVVENLMNHVDAFIIGGAMAYTFLKAKGVKVGRSLVDESKIHQAGRLLERASVKGVDILLPVDSLLAPRIEEGVEIRIARNEEDWDNWMGCDIGPESIKIFKEEIASAHTIFWNGPMGAFETAGFEKGTEAMALAITQNKGMTVVGGGDSISAVKQAGYADRVTHLCTGGGAALEFLEGKKLPGLKVLEI